MKLFTSIFFVGALALGLTPVRAGNLPDLGDYSQTVLSSQQAAVLGQRIFQDIRAQVPLVNDLIVNAYVQSLGQQLAGSRAQGIHRQQQVLHFFVVDSPVINAFAFPGGYIGINTGLMMAAESEAELAGVMAHEIAHVTQNHFSRSLEKAQAQTLPSVLGIVAAAAVGGPAAQAAAIGGLAGSKQMVLDHSRAQEKEADRMGAQLLLKAGYNPKALASFLGRMARYNLHPSILEDLQTHPSTFKRMADFTFHGWQGKNNPHASQDFFLVQQRLLVQRAKAEGSLLQLGDIYKKYAEARYGYSLVLARLGKLAQAQALMVTLQRNNPSQPIYTLGLASILQARQQGAQALPLLQSAYDHTPEYYPALVAYLNALLSEKQASKAQQVASEALADFPDHSELLRLLARAQGEAGSVAESYFTRSKAYLVQGNNLQAQRQLQIGLQRYKQEPRLVARFKSQLHALELLQP